jgi:hypothetical protein
MLFNRSSMSAVNFRLKFLFCWSAYLNMMFCSTRAKRGYSSTVSDLTCIFPMTNRFSYALSVPTENTCCTHCLPFALLIFLLCLLNKHLNLTVFILLLLQAIVTFLIPPTIFSYVCFITICLARPECFWLLGKLCALFVTSI